MSRPSSRLCSYAGMYLFTALKPLLSEISSKHACEGLNLAL